MNQVIKVAKVAVSVFCNSQIESDESLSVESEYQLTNLKF